MNRDDVSRRWPKLINTFGANYDTSPVGCASWWESETYAISGLGPQDSRTGLIVRAGRAYALGCRAIGTNREGGDAPRGGDEISFGGFPTLQEWKQGQLETVFAPWWQALGGAPTWLRYSGGSLRQDRDAANVCLGTVDDPEGYLDGELCPLSDEANMAPHLPDLGDPADAACVVASLAPWVLIAPRFIQFYDNFGASAKWPSLVALHEAFRDGLLGGTDVKAAGEALPVLIPGHLPDLDRIDQAPCLCEWRFLRSHIYDLSVLTLGQAEADAVWASLHDNEAARLQWAAPWRTTQAYVTFTDDNRFTREKQPLLDDGLTPNPIYLPDALLPTRDDIRNVATLGLIPGAFSSDASDGLIADLMQRPEVTGPLAQHGGGGVTLSWGWPTITEQTGEPIVPVAVEIRRSATFAGPRTFLAEVAYPETDYLDGTAGGTDWYYHLRLVTAHFAVSEGLTLPSVRHGPLGASFPLPGVPIGGDAVARGRGWIVPLDNRGYRPRAPEQDDAMVTREKDPAEVVDFPVDYSRTLADGDTLVDSSWALAAGDDESAPEIETHNFTTTASTVWLSGGEANQQYVFRNTIVTAGGRTIRRRLRIAVKER